MRAERGRWSWKEERRGCCVCWQLYIPVGGNSLTWIGSMLHCVIHSMGAWMTVAMWLMRRKYKYRTEFIKIMGWMDLRWGQCCVHLTCSYIEFVCGCGYSHWCGTSAGTLANDFTPSFPQRFNNLPIDMYPKPNRLSEKNLSRRITVSTVSQQHAKEKVGI